MKEYETTYILQPTLTDADVKNSIERTIALITRHSGHIFRSHSLGKRTLAYRIQKQSKGFYVFIDYCGDNTTVIELERMLNFDEQILRFLTVKIADEVDIEARKKQLIDDAAALTAAAAGPAEEVKKHKTEEEEEIYA